MRISFLCVALAASATCAAADCRQKITDAAKPAETFDVRMLDRVGRLFRSSLDLRVYSEHARGAVYDEAENAFATHWDDTGDHTGWQNEYWGKTMLCYAGAVDATQDAALRAWCVEKAHRLIDTYQHADGYLSTYGRQDFLRKDPESPDPGRHWCFNIWGQKYTMWALVELYRVSGDRKCLEAAERMTDQIIAQLKRLGITLDQTGSWAGISSMSILKPLLALYRETGKSAYLDLAKYVVKATDVDGEKRPIMNVIHDAFTDRPIVEWFDRPTLLAKAYELMSFFEGVADYYRVTGDRRALAATEAFWGHLMREELNPMRSASYFDHFLASKRRVNGMTELCDVTHWIRLNRELWLLTGETKYLDCIEEAFYNAFLAGVSLDGGWGCHVIRSHGSRHLSAPPQTGMKLHQCCPDNMLRTFYDWLDTVAAVAQDGAYELNLFSDADVKLPGLRLEVRGGYPVSDRFRVRAVADADCRLRLRVPGWSKTVRVDGREMPVADGRCEIALAKGSRTCEVAFDMTPRVIDSEAQEKEDLSKVTPDDTRKEGFTRTFMYWNAPEMKGLARTTPAAQVMRGPLVLAKGRIAGTDRGETFDFKTVNRQGWKASVVPAGRTAANAAAWGVWSLTLEKGGEKRTVPVADYWSVSNVDDPENWFSLWF